MADLRVGNLLKHNTDKWGFVGWQVPAVLAFATEDGQEPTEDQLKAAQVCGPVMAGLKSKSFNTLAEATAYATKKAPTYKYNIVS